MVNKNALYELNQKGKIKKKLTLKANMNSVCRMIRKGNYLYIPLSDGFVQCVKISTMKSHWESEHFGGQSLSSLYYKNNRLYAGTTNITGSNTTSGIFYCLDATTGKTIWTYEDTKNPGAYYWSGATSDGNTLYFVGDNGLLVSHSLTNSQVIETFPLTLEGKIRSGIVYDKDTKALYTTSTKGEIFKIKVSSTGHIQSAIKTQYLCYNRFANSTSTPTIYNKRIYVGGSADGQGYLTVLDATTLQVLYRVSTGKGKEVKSQPLVLPAENTTEENVYVYFTGNAIPGSLHYILDRKEKTNATLKTLFKPGKKKQQFCISNVFSDKQNVLYYSNDSGTLFAISK